jgi:hypothetical protein
MLSPAKDPLPLRETFPRSMYAFGGLILLFIIVGRESVFTYFVLIPLGLIIYLTIKNTKFCDWCGHTIRLNLPFRRKGLCPRCGSDVDETRSYFF